MKRLILGILVWAFPAICFGGSTGKGISPGSYVTEGVYKSTFTNIEQSSGSVVFSSVPVILHTVVVSSAGFDSTFNAFDARLSTQTSSVSVLNNRVAYINTGSVGSYTYDVYCSSGFVFWNKGNPPAAVTVTYLDFPPTGRR